MRANRLPYVQYLSVTFQRQDDYNIFRPFSQESSGVSRAFYYTPLYAAGAHDKIGYHLLQGEQAMNSRDPFPDEELRRRIMDFIMAAGQTLLENGAEVDRDE